MNYNDTYMYYDQTPSVMDVLLGSVPFLIFMAVMIIFGIIVRWKIFVKAGIPGWWSLIPFANAYKMFELFWGAGKGWMFLLLFVPIANVVVSIMLLVKMAHSFGKGGGFAAGLIFIPIIFAAILAFGSDKYIGPDGVAPYNPQNSVQ